MFANVLILAEAFHEKFVCLLCCCRFLGKQGGHFPFELCLLYESFEFRKVKMPLFDKGMKKENPG